MISQVTEAVLDEVCAWQNRPLEAVYPIIWLDGIVVKVRQGKQVIRKAVHVVLGVIVLFLNNLTLSTFRHPILQARKSKNNYEKHYNLRGEKEVLGLWITENEGAKYWLSVLMELKNRGVQDIFIACMDDLKGLPGAVNALYPKTLTQLCIAHLVRASLRYVSAREVYV